MYVIDLRFVKDQRYLRVSSVFTSLKKYSKSCFMDRLINNSMNISEKWWQIWLAFFPEFSVCNWHFQILCIRFLMSLLIIIYSILLANIFKLCVINCRYFLLDYNFIQYFTFQNPLLFVICWEMSCRKNYVS